MAMVATLVNLQPYLRGKHHRYAIFCQDGFSFCCNAGSAYYCEPRSDNAGFYRKVEIAHPSDVDRNIRIYAEDFKNLLGSTYKNVPLDVVVKMINDHGGIDTNAMDPEAE